MFAIRMQNANLKLKGLSFKSRNPKKCSGHYKCMIEMDYWSLSLRSSSHTFFFSCCLQLVLFAILYFRVANKFGAQHSLCDHFCVVACEIQLFKREVLF